MIKIIKEAQVRSEEDNRNLRETVHISALKYIFLRCRLNPVAVGLGNGI